MKTLIKSCFATLVVLTSSLFATMSEAKRSFTQDEPIVIQWEVPEFEEGPRTTVFIPFYAEYIFGGNVSLSSLDSIGTVVVEISSTAGDYYCTYFDTSDGSILLPVSGDPGYYLLRITVSSSVHYNGRFEL